MKFSTKLLLNTIILFNATTLLAMDPSIIKEGRKSVKDLQKMFNGGGSGGEKSVLNGQAAEGITSISSSSSNVFHSVSASQKNGETESAHVVISNAVNDSFSTNASELRGGEIKKQLSKNLKSTGGNDDVLAEEEDVFFTPLDIWSFYNIAKEHPNAKRLIIEVGSYGETIVARDANPKTSAKNKKENFDIMRALKGLISQPIADQELPFDGREMKECLPLSSERLQEILKKADEDVAGLNDLETQSTASGYTQYTHSYLGKEIMGNIEEKYVAKTLYKMLQESQNAKDIFGKLNENVPQVATTSSSFQATAEQKAALFETEFAETIREAKVQVEEAAEVAETAREKAETQGMSEKAWNIATEEAEIAEAAFIHLTDLYNMYQKQAAEHYEGGILESRRSKYKFELMKAEKKKSHWTSEVEECKQKKGALKEGEVKKALDQRLLEVKAAQEQEKARLEIEKKVTEERASIAEQARIERERKEEAAVKAKETLAEVAEQEEAAIQRAKEEAEQMIITKAREGEEAFSLARQLEENESVWETAKRVTLSISNYWNGIIKDLQAGRATLALNQEKATFQKEYWLEKSQVADLRLLSLKMLRSGCYEQDRADALISMVREKAWPIVSKTMKSFIEHPSEAKMLTVREFASALFSASTVSSPYTFIYPFSVDSVYISSYDSSVAFASAASNEAYTTLSNEAYAGTFAEAAASAAASAYAFALTSSSISAIASASTVTSVFAVASVYVSANAAASAAICAVSSSICAVVSASEALAATNLADNLADDIQFSVDLSKKIYKNFSEIQIENLEWAVNTTREIANYAHAVANYKAEQEALHRNSLCQPTESQGWEKRVNLTWAQANREKNETAWKLAGAAAREAMTKCQQVQGIPPQEILRQKAYWKERSDIAEFKALAMSFCANNWRARSKRIRDLMEMACKKFGSPISPTMKEFIAHPSEVTLRATGKSFVIPMTASEATAIVEKAEFFANLVAEGAALAKMNRWGVEDQERMNWLATITQEALEFARAVANFKNLQNS